MSTFQIVDIQQLSPADALLRAAKAVVKDHNNPDGNYESTEKAMADLRSAIRAVELQPGPGGWIAWNGGPCPVEFETIVDIARAGGVIELHVIAGHYTWGHHRISADRDITSYRLSPPRSIAMPPEIGQSISGKTGEA